MDDNVFAPPKAKLEDKKDSQPFFITSSRKLWILTIMTIGFYYYYWFYKQWQYHKYHYDSKIMPVMRTIFSVFYIYPLFLSVDAAAKQSKIKPVINLKLLAVLTIIIVIAEGVIDWMAQFEAFTYWGYLGYLLMYFSLVPFFIVQLTINQVLGDPKGATNDTLSVYNYLFIFFGLGGYIYIIASLLEINLDFLSEGIDTLLNQSA